MLRAQSHKYRWDKITMKRTMINIRLVLLILGACLFNTVVEATTVTLNKVQLSETPSTARVKLEFSQDISMESFELHNPERYVIDLNHVTLAAELPSKNYPSPLKKIRSNSDAEKLRIVLDLEQNIKPQLMKTKHSKLQSATLTINIPRQGMKAAHPEKSLGRLSYAKKPSKAQPLPEPKAIEADDDSEDYDDDQEEEKQHSIQALPDPSAVKLRAPRDVVVVIDAGHGGKDPGAKGCNGTQEKDVVLEIAKRLQYQINQQPGFKAVLTRKGDYFIGLRERLDLARKYRGDMFIAIHADAHEHLDACGVGVYALSQRGATSEAARWLAQRENASEFVGGLDLSDKDHVLKSVLIDLSQTQSITASLQMGSVLLQHLGKFAPLHHNTVEQAAFVVLKSPDIPSLLIETGFISNTREERRLRSPQYQTQIAEALLIGIKDYFVHHPPRGSSLALTQSNKGRRT